MLELKRLHVLSSILVFCAILVYLIYKSFNRLQGLDWGILLWIVVLFSGINAITKSFSQDQHSTRIYNYTLFDPLEVLASKLIYNFLFIVLILTVTYFGFSFFMGQQIKDFSLFAIGSLIGCAGLSIIFTFISAISNQGENNAVMMSVMAIPVTIPIILLLIKITAVAMRLLQDTSVDDDVLMLSGIVLLLGGLVFFLFEELWRD
jgi:heme exporter protein B